AGATYYLPILIVTGNGEVELLLGGALVVPWLSQSVASSLDITLGSLDADQQTITLDNLIVIDPVKGETTSYNVLLNYDLTTTPISFGVVSVSAN
ncbi:MAG: hypothetical protein QM504_10590, partial [Pseudomonadota bacterium]